KSAATTEISPLSLHDALPIYHGLGRLVPRRLFRGAGDLGPPAPAPQDPSGARGRLQREEPVRDGRGRGGDAEDDGAPARQHRGRSEEHTSELQSLTNLVCRLL